MQNNSISIKGNHDGNASMALPVEMASSLSLESTSGGAFRILPWLKFSLVTSSPIVLDGLQKQ